MASETLTGVDVALRIGGLILTCALLSALFVACGGGAPGSAKNGINPGGRGANGTGTGGSTSGGGSTGGSGGSGGSGGGSGLAAPAVVSVSANQTVTGINIAVAAPSGVNPNAIALGAVP